MGYTGMYLTIQNCIAGFRGAHRDATLMDAVEPPRPLGSESDQQHEDMDPDPCPEDGEVFTHLMLRAWKRQSASLWRAWSFRKAVAFKTSTD